MWLTAEWMDYWLDVGSGEYATGERPEWLSRPTVIRAIQKPDPAPVTFTPEEIGRFLEESDMMAAPGEEFEAFIGSGPQLPAAWH